MKIFVLSAVALALLAATTSAQNGIPALKEAPPAADGPSRGEQRFDLKFPGGDVRQFVAAVSTQLGRPLNVIIPPEFADEEIPPLEVFGTTAGSLFRAVSHASGGQLIFFTEEVVQSVNLNTIWTFRSQRESGTSVQRKVRYYPVGEFLPRFTVEDITTAIQAGWALHSEITWQAVAALKFHEETKLLICSAPVELLEMIPDVLEGLGKVPYPRSGEVIRKAKAIVLPRLEIREGSITEAIDFLRRKSTELDRADDPSLRGVNIVPDYKSISSSQKISLVLSNVPLLDALQAVASLSGLEVEPRDSLLFLKASSTAKKIVATETLPPSTPSAEPGTASPVK